jgi:hypothetical protein
MEEKMNPEMGKLLQPAHHLPAIEGWPEFQSGGGGPDHSRLPRNSKLLGKAGVDHAYRGYFHFKLRTGFYYHFIQLLPS